MAAHKCKKCSRSMSLFWYPLNISDMHVGELCDRCYSLFVAFMEAKE